MRAWMQDVGDDEIAMVHATDGADLDNLMAHCAHLSETHKAGGDLKLAMSVDGTVIMDWCNKRGIAWNRFFQDSAIQTRFIEDPDNAAFRVWKGRL